MPVFMANISYLFLLMKTGLSNPLPLYIIYNIGYAAFIIPLGKARLAERKWVLPIVYLVFSLNLAMFAFTRSLLHTAVLFAIHGMCFGFIRTGTKAMVADAVREKGTEIGLYNIAVGMSYLAGNLIYGILFSISASLPFLVASAMAFISSVLFILFSR